jgi:tRNA1Val (adenine37-N6)-methyltransferase
MRPSATDDSLFRGALPLWQPKTGFRVTIDALVVAAFASSGRTAKLCVDLGAGTGAIALALHHVGAAREVALVEREPDLVALAQRNLERVGVTGRVERADLQTRGLPSSLVQRADLVVSNPPFFPTANGRPRMDPKSRHARSGDLSPFLKAAARALSGSRARACFVYPAPELSDLFTRAAELGLIAKRLRFVHADTGKPARIALVEFRLAKPGGLVTEPPLFEWSARGRRSPELERIVAGRFGTRA